MKNGSNVIINFLKDCTIYYYFILTVDETLHDVMLLIIQ